LNVCQIAWFVAGEMVVSCMVKLVAKMSYNCLLRPAPARWDFEAEIASNLETGL
jgi:hypothetical protein